MNNLILISLIIISFVYRAYGLGANWAFWTDENHVAIFARAILERGKPILINGYSTGVYQWLQYWLSATSAKFLGLSEFAIRFPSIIFGALTTWAVYLLGKELFNKNVGLVAAFFTTFLRVEILWSRQARPYQALQFFSVLGAYFIYKLAREEKWNWRFFGGFLICGALASLMHGLGLAIFLIGFFYLLLCGNPSFKRTFFLISMPIFLALAGLFWDDILGKIIKLGTVNNLFYYRVFLSHHHLLLTAVAGVGGLLLMKERQFTKIILFALFLGVQTFIAAYLLSQPFSRYFSFAFPFLILLASFNLGAIASHLSERLLKISKMRDITTLFLALLLMLISGKFSLLPQKIYSLNEDMQETPEVDWKKIYSYVENKLDEDPKMVLVTNWNDLPVWYLGEGKLNYLLRKEEGIAKDSFSLAQMISDVDSLKQVVKKEEEGLLVLDSWDNFIPDGVREYIQENLKKELQVDRLYPLQPRYWPVEVYSWRHRN